MTTGMSSNVGVIFKIAESAYQESASKPIQSYTAVIFSCIGLEAFINLFSDNMFPFLLEDTPTELFTLQKILEYFESSRESIIAKYSIIPLLLTGKPWDKEQRPFQDFDCLIKIRNALVHSRPGRFDLSDTSRDNQHPKFLEHLINLNIITRPPKRPHQSWESLIRGSDVAQWAFNTACWMMFKTITFIPDCNAKLLFATIAPNIEVKIEYDEDVDKNEE